MSTPFDAGEPTRSLPYAPLDRPAHPATAISPADSGRHAQVREQHEIREPREPGVTPESLHPHPYETGFAPSAGQPAAIPGTPATAGVGVNVLGVAAAAVGVAVALACALTLAGVSLPSSSVIAVVAVAVLACVSGILIGARRCRR